MKHRENWQDILVGTPFGCVYGVAAPWLLPPISSITDVVKALGACFPCDCRLF